MIIVCLELTSAKRFLDYMKSTPISAFRLELPPRATTASCATQPLFASLSLARGSTTRPSRDVLQRTRYSFHRQPADAEPGSSGTLKMDEIGNPVFVK